jgi:hypothetical protein
MRNRRIAREAREVFFLLLPIVVLACWMAKLVAMGIVAVWHAVFH